MRGLDRMRLSVVAPIAVAVVFVVAVILGLYAYFRSHPEVEIPAENRHAFARVAILMDGTCSVGEDNFATIQEIVQRKIIPSLGVNDLAVAYDVHPTFTLRQNAVFGLRADAMPQDPESRRAAILEILERNRASKVPDEDLYDLIRALSPRWRRVDEVRAAWARQVQARPLASCLGSDLCSPLRDLGKFLRRGDPDAERWLFVLSDLNNETQARVCRPDEPFPDARVVLVYPFDSESPEWEKIESFWKGFFGDRELERLPFSSALVDDPLLPANPTAGLERYEGLKTTWEYLHPSETAHR